MNPKKLWAVLLCAALMLASMTGFAFAEEVAKPEGDGYFAEWNPDAPALNALIEYVEDVTDPDSPNFIPEADRIATFDMDGTLMAELAPTYLEVMLLTERILADKTYLESVYRSGAERAARTAARTLRKVYKKVGFVAD